MHKKDHFLTLDHLKDKTLDEIYELARKYKIPSYADMNKKELSLR